MEPLPPLPPPTEPPPTDRAYLRCLGCGQSREHVFSHRRLRSDVPYTVAHDPAFYELIFCCISCGSERVWGTEAQ